MRFSIHLAYFLLIILLLIILFSLASVSLLCLLMFTFTTNVLYCVLIFYFFILSFFNFLIDNSPFDCVISNLAFLLFETTTVYFL